MGDRVGQLRSAGCQVVNLHKEGTSLDPDFPYPLCLPWAMPCTVVPPLPPSERCGGEVGGGRGGRDVLR